MKYWDIQNLKGVNMKYWDIQNLKGVMKKFSDPESAEAREWMSNRDEPRAKAEPKKTPKAKPEA